MKFLPIIAIFIISIFLQCKQEEKVEFIPSGTMSKEDNLASALFLIDMYVYRNNCPPYTLLEPGNTTVYLKEGEEYWFDITSRLGNTKSNSEYLIKIEQSSGQKIEAKDRSCLVNGIFTASNRPIFTSNNARKIPIDSTNGNTISLRFSFDSSTVPGASLGIIKSNIGSGNVTLTIPTQATFQF
ncbi:MAG: hypothetical protein GW938_14710 [Leptospira sp.]|nr:hypothetical protein [Leptospira sp.]NCS94285.1 hypothetical protein [Leptospira sp.]